MYQAYVAARVVAETAAEEGGHELPMSPLGFGLTAAVLFLFLLAVTYAFRSIGHRHAPEAFSHPGNPHYGPSHGHGSGHGHGH